MSDSYFRTEKRIEKIKWVVSKRQPSLHVVFENIHDPHNVSAIFRTCDAAGVPKVSLIYNVEKFPKIGRNLLPLLTNGLKEISTNQLMNATINLKKKNL